MTQQKNIAIIGAGISGLATAAHLAKAGHRVQIFEKNTTIGGRGRKFTTENGFVFDMGPSWYWMPDVFDRFYAQFGYTSKDFYTLKRLDPSYQIIWAENDVTPISANLTELKAFFETLEPGSAQKLDAFLLDASKKYAIGMQELVYKPSLSLLEFAQANVLKGIFNMHLFTSYAKFIRRYFTHPKICSILEFPILFLGATPENTPALYSLMNYADIQLGTWYPMGGMYSFFEAFETIAREQGVEILTDHEVVNFSYNEKNIQSLKTTQGDYLADIVVNSGDYAHIESLLGEKSNYSRSYWDKRTMAPSSLIYYLGINTEIPNLLHHNLYFDKPFDQHAIEIYDHPQWPSDPLFYACCPSKTDPSVAPKGMENLFLLMPLAPDLEDREEVREAYFNKMMTRLEKQTGCPIRDHIVYKKSYCINDFKSDYHAYKGNAYGLANTLKQTAILKPKITSKKINNLFHTGQLTVPGPGIPPSIISGEVVAKHILSTI
jgi:phytoene desaturase